MTDMKQYRIPYLPTRAMAELDGGRAFGEQALPESLLSVEPAPIDQYPWDRGGFRPRSEARLAWNREGLYALLTSDEREPRHVLRSFGDMVCEDSCLECFFRPEDGREYMNVECNPLGTVLMAVGPDRHARRQYPSLPEGMRVSHAKPGDGWAVSFFLPASLLEAAFGLSLREGLRLRGNLYKCGDRTPSPHWGCWQPIDAGQPDFHRPEQFGLWVLG